MGVKYEAWETEDGVVLFESRRGDEMRHVEALVNKLYEFEAATYEEAASIHSLRMGWGPYTPMGEPRACEQCGAWYYPSGSSHCWRCGPDNNIRDR